MSTFDDLLTSLIHNARSLSKELKSSSSGQYNFDDEAAGLDLSRLSSDGLEARLAVISSAEKLLRLTKGPSECLLGFGAQIFELGTIKALIELQVPYLIPLGTSMSYRDLASKTGVSEELITRLIRFAIIAGLFMDAGNDRVRHNSMSSLFLRSHNIGEGCQWAFTAEYQACAHFSEALKLNPRGERADQVPLSIAFRDHNYPQPNMWSLLEGNSLWRSQFHSYMIAECSSPMYSLHYVVDAFAWDQIRTLVDVGGSHGHTSIAIAEKYPRIHCTVQDIGHIISAGIKTLDPALLGRIAFKEHSFFSLQDQVADAYLLRLILHDWPDKEARSIIRNLVPALRDGAWLIIMDTVVPEPGCVPAFLEKRIRALDIGMFTLLAGKERSLEQFITLIAAVEPRLLFQSCITPAGSILSFMVWRFKDA